MRGIAPLASACGRMAALAALMRALAAAGAAHCAVPSAAVSTAAVSTAAVSTAAVSTAAVTALAVVIGVDAKSLALVFGEELFDGNLAGDLLAKVLLY